jgi:hypothetical protein
MQARLIRLGYATMTVASLVLALGAGKRWC